MVLDVDDHLHLQYPFFSIIIPLYNSERYIEDCINSVAMQTFYSVEIIVVDDGSTDNSFNICAQLRSKFDNIYLYKQPNSGPFNARLNGIKHAKGVFLLFVDSDDMLHPMVLKELYDVIKNTNSDIVLFNLSNREDYSIPSIKYPFKHGEVFFGDRKKILYNLICSSTFLNNLATKCIKRNLINKEDLKPVNHFYNGEDLYFFIPLVTRAEKVIFINGIYYYYRLNQYSTTHNYNKYYYYSIKRMHQRCINYSKRWKTETSALKKASKSCINSLIQILRSQLSDAECMEELKKIYEDSFFQECIKHKPLDSTKREHFVYSVVKFGQFRENMLILRLMRLIMK